MSKLVNHLKEPLLREAAADCIHEIITKGMDPVNKTQLIESFVTVLDQGGVLKPIDVSFFYFSFVVRFWGTAVSGRY